MQGQAELKPAELPNQLLNGPQVQEATSFADGAVGFTPDVAYDDAPTVIPPVTVPPEGGTEVPPINGGEVVTAVPGVLVPERVKPPKPNKYRVEGTAPAPTPKLETSDKDRGDKAPGRLRKAALAAAVVVGATAGALAGPVEFPEHSDKVAVDVGDKPVAEPTTPTKKAKSALPGGIKLENPRVPTSDGNFGEPNPEAPQK